MIKQQLKPILTLPLIGGIICLVLEFAFAYYRIPLFSFPIFIVGFFILVYVPGRFILSCLQLKITPLERLTLELGSGYLVSTLVLFLVRAAKLDPVYFLIIGALFIHYLYQLIKKGAPWPQIELKYDWFEFCFFLVFSLVILSCGLVNFDSWIFTADGSMIIRSLHNRDIFFHVSLTHELANNFLPRIPFAGNYPFAYHFFPELLGGFFVRWFNLTPWDLTVRYLPLFHFTLLFLATFIGIRRLTQSAWVALLAVFMVNFMGNLGFIYQYFAPYLDHPHTEGYFVPQTLILHINPLQMALTVILLGIYCLANYLEDSRPSWLFLTTLFFGLVSFYKVFTALQVLLGIGIPALIIVWRDRDWRLFKVGFTAGLLSLFVVLFFWIQSPFRGNFIEFKPWFLVFYNQRLLLKGIEQLQFTYEKFFRLMFGLGLGSFLYYFVWLGLLFLLGSLGLRVIGIKLWLNDLVKLKKPAWSVIAYTILVGFVFSLIITIPTEDYNTVVFITISIYLMSLYAAWGLIKISERWQSFTKIVVVVLFISLSVPTTINLFLAQPGEVHVPPQFVRLGQYIKKNIPPGSIIAHPYQAVLYLMLPALGGVRTMAELVIPIELYIGKKATFKLRKDNMTLYKTTNPQQLQSILLQNNVDYLIEDQEEMIRCSKRGILTEIYRGDGYIINQVVR